ncbi:MAG: DUF2384 domain-containing protein [Planctomycetota bacterium]|nr:DUF2384 domain-containing protein [Planctomycetota bacterium]
MGADDSAKLVRSVRVGFVFTHVTRLQKAAGLSWDALAKVVQIPPRTLTRRQAGGRLTPEESDRVHRAATIFAKALELFDGDAVAARRWLEAPQHGLSGESPWDRADTGIGARQVEDLIIRLEHGVFS